MPKIRNPFDDAIKAYDQAEEVEKANEMFEPKSYQDRNRNLKNAAIIGGYTASELVWEKLVFFGCENQVKSIGD